MRGGGEREIEGERERDRGGYTSTGFAQEEWISFKCFTFQKHQNLFIIITNWLHLSAYTV